MSSYSRRSLLGMPLALAACGFSPAFAPGGTAAGLQGAFRLVDPASKNDFDFVERMEELVGRPTADIYLLSYTIQTAAVPLGYTPSGEITRYNLTGNLTYQVSRDGTDVAAGRVESFTAWSATGSVVAGLSAEEDAARRLMRILADQVTARLLSAGLAP